jgi:hypothetical protein
MKAFRMVYITWIEAYQNGPVELRAKKWDFVFKRVRK